MEKYSIDKNYIKEKLTDLVSIYSVTGSEEQVARYIAQELMVIGVENVELMNVEGGMFNVTGSISGGELGPTVLFTGHMDTVPAGEGWVTDPFSAYIDGDRLYGRGALDMKSGIAAVLGAVKVVAKEKEKLRGNIRIAFVSDEEATSKGVNKLIDSGLAADFGIEHFGGVDILVNDAGIGAYEKPFEEISNDEWDHMMAVDLTGVFKVCREVVPYMKKKRWGKIVNISSGSGIIGCEFCSHYATAKAGLIGFTQSIAKELASWHINANAIAVPTTETEMLAETGFDEKIEDVSRNVPWGRIGRPKDIADMVLYLSSDASEYVTGQILAPNGGLRTPI